MIYIKNMSLLKKGEKAKVKSLCISGNMRRRLLDIGLIRGTEVSCLHESPCGNPKAYIVRGAIIAIRNEDASKIVVEYDDES